MALIEKSVPLELFVSKITELQELIRHSQEILNNNSLLPCLTREIFEFTFYCRRQEENSVQYSSNFFVSKRAKFKKEEGLTIDAQSYAEILLNLIIIPFFQQESNENLRTNNFVENGFINISCEVKIKKMKEEPTEESFEIEPIGHIETVFGEKHGTPRQGCLAPDVRGKIKLRKDLDTMCLANLNEFSHLWIIWIFDQNTNTRYHPMVKPPRLFGEKTGVFATRSPHRPNPIGLTLVKIIKIIKKTVLVSGIDLVNGTSILDIKPYIPLDNISNSTQPDWIEAPHFLLNVVMTEYAKNQIEHFVTSKEGLKFYDKNETENVIRAIEQTIGLDPRSQHSKDKHKPGALYGLQFDRLDVVFQILIEEEKEIGFIRFVEYNSGNLAKRRKLNCEQWLQRGLEILEKINEEEKNKSN